MLYDTKRDSVLLLLSFTYKLRTSDFQEARVEKKTKLTYNCVSSWRC